MTVMAETSGGQRLIRRAHRRMPRGVGEWLVEGDGRILVGCCVITAVETIRGVRHGCETNFDTTDAKIRVENLH
eukprot:scaffold126557_cov76-Cyclotella_meneghiniana.AAC.1